MLESAKAKLDLATRTKSNLLAETSKVLTWVDLRTCALEENQYLCYLIGCQANINYQGSRLSLSKSWVPMVICERIFCYSLCFPFPTYLLYFWWNLFHLSVFLFFPISGISQWGGCIWHNSWCIYHRSVLFLLLVSDWQNAVMFTQNLRCFSIRNHICILFRVGSLSLIICCARFFCRCTLTVLKG